jgi:hypothetical protein
VGPNIHYVRIVGAPTDPAGITNELPDGEVFDVIPDSGSDWTYIVKVPDAGVL